MSNEPQVLDEQHPAMSPTIEMLSLHPFETPDFVKVGKHIETLHQSISIRVDDTLPFGPGNRLQCEALLSTGPSFHGKTFSTGRGLKNLKPVRTQDGRVIQPKVLSFRCPSYASVSSLLNSLLRATGYPLQRDLPPALALSRLTPALHTKQYTAIHFDEFQWALNPTTSPGRSREQEENLVWNTIAGIIDSAVWPIPVIISGLPVVADSLNAETEERQALRNRFNVVQMRSMTIGQSRNLADAVAKYCEIADLTNVIHKDFELGKRLTHASNYAFGMGLRFARLAAARAALRPERQLTSEDFADAYAVKLGCSDAANPFKISDWRAVDASLLLAQSADQRRLTKVKAK